MLRKASKVSVALIVILFCALLFVPLSAFGLGLDSNSVVQVFSDEAALPEVPSDNNGEIEGDTDVLTKEETDDSEKFLDEEQDKLIQSPDKPVSADDDQLSHDGDSTSGDEANASESTGLNEWEGEVVKESVQAPVDNVSAYVIRLYKNVLGRDPDASGLAFYVNALRSGSSAADVAWTFFSSPEFNKKSLTNDQRVEAAYITMLDRPADIGGLAYHKQKLDAGMSLKPVIVAFAVAPEFRSLCNKWGITPGALYVTENRDKSLSVTKFVQSLYQKVLGRSADIGGLNWHAGTLLSGSSAAELAWAFFSSSEFDKKSLTNDQKVEIIYQTMLDRPADIGGLAYHKQKLDAGMSLKPVIVAFAVAPEFRSLCNKWGITPGALYVTENRDKSLSVTKFVQKLYRTVLERAADIGGLNVHTGSILASGSAATAAYSLLSSSECLAKRLTNGQQIDLAYKAMFDRSADSGGLSHYTTLLDLGMGIGAVLVEFSNSNEYKQMCFRNSLPSGAFQAVENRDKSINITKFVQRLYRNALGRSGGANELNSYTGELLNGGLGANVALSFFNSTEFSIRNLSNEAKVNAAFKALLDRAPTTSEKAQWVANLNSGTSVQSLAELITLTGEFRNLCHSCGIVPDQYWDMDCRVSSLSSNTGWLIVADTNRCIVSVYTGNQGNWNAIVRFPCAPGKPSTPSRKGLYTVGIKGYVFGHGYSCYYYTQYSGDYLFHSIKYNPGTFVVQDGTMGAPASMGCIRLWIENAKYIYDHVPSGSTVYVY